MEAEFDPLTAPIEQLIERSNPQHHSGTGPTGGFDEAPTPPVEEAPLVDLVDSRTAIPDEAAPPEPEAVPAVSDVDVMLSMLAAEHRQGDPTARWAGTMDDKATRITVMAGGALLIAGVGFLLLTILGAIF